MSKGINRLFPKQMNNAYVSICIIKCKMGVEIEETLGRDYSGFYSGISDTMHRLYSGFHTGILVLLCI